MNRTTDAGRYVTSHDRFRLGNMLLDPAHRALGDRNCRTALDTRFIGATHRDLAMEVNAGRFRRDLFYCLAEIHIELPPLRRRNNDAVLLAQHFLAQLQPVTPEAKLFTPAAIQVLSQYSWPGNIRELRNAVEHGLAMSRTRMITPQDLPTSLHQTSTVVTVRDEPPVAGSRSATMDKASRDYLIVLLRENAGNVSRSASQAGMSRQGMHKLLRKHAINAADDRR